VICESTSANLGSRLLQNSVLANRSNKLIQRLQRYCHAEICCHIITTARTDQRKKRINKCRERVVSAQNRLEPTCSRPVQAKATPTRPQHTCQVPTTFSRSVKDNQRHKSCPWRNQQPADGRGRATGSSKKKKQTGEASMISIAAWLRIARLRFPGPRDLPWKQGPARVVQRRRLSYEDVNVKPHVSSTRRKRKRHGSNENPS